MVDLVKIGKLKISEKSIFHLVVTLKSYIAECWNSLWVNIATDTVYKPGFIQIGKGKDFLRWFDMEWPNSESAGCESYTVN